MGSGHKAAKNRRYQAAVQALEQEGLRLAARNAAAPLLLQGVEQLARRAALHAGHSSRNSCEMCNYGQMTSPELIFCGACDMAACYPCAQVSDASPSELASLTWLCNGCATGRAFDIVAAYRRGAHRMKAESCVGEGREAARRAARETHLRGTDAEHSARVKGRAFKSITNAARAAAAIRESAWVAGGGDPAALHTSSDASAQVRCTICSSACVHVPCPVPGCGLQQCARCRHALCVVPTGIRGLYGSDGELVTACRPSGSKCLTHATLEQMERNAAEAQEQRNAADALRAPPIRSTWRSVQSGGLFHLVLADFAKVPEGTKGLVQQLSLEDVQEGEGIFVFSLARFKSGSNNMTLEYAPRDRFMALGHALEARGGGGGGGGETSCASAEAAASLLAEGYRPMLVGGNPPALPFGPNFTGKLTDFQSVAHGIPILYASLNGTDDPNILTRMVANKLCSGNAGTACERVFATDDYREGAVLAPMSLTSATHTMVKQIYPNKGGEVVSFETRNQPELNAYHLWDVGEAGRLLGQEQVEPLLKWGLALPLQLFALAFQELALGSEKGTCAPPFGFTKVSAMWPADVMARTRTADANLFSRLELGSSGTHGHLSHTDCTQTCRRTGVMAPGVVTAGHLRLASAMGRDHCSSSSSSSSLARTTFTLSAFGIALPVYTEGLRLRPAITDLANMQHETGAPAREPCLFFIGTGVEEKMKREREGGGILGSLQRDIAKMGGRQPAGVSSMSRRGA
jgi:hypothetical protein